MKKTWIKITVITVIASLLCQDIAFADYKLSARSPFEMAGDSDSLLAAAICKAIKENIGDGNLDSVEKYLKSLGNYRFSRLENEVKIYLPSGKMSVRCYVKKGRLKFSTQKIPPPFYSKRIFKIIGLSVLIAVSYSYLAVALIDLYGFYTLINLFIKFLPYMLVIGASVFGAGIGGWAIWLIKYGFKLIKKGSTFDLLSRAVKSTEKEQPKKSVSFVKYKYKKITGRKISAVKRGIELSVEEERKLEEPPSQKDEVCRYMLYYKDKVNKFAGIVTVLEMDYDVISVEVEWEPAAQKRQLPKRFVVKELANRNPEGIIFRGDDIDIDIMDMLLPNHTPSSDKNKSAKRREEELLQKLSMVKKEGCVFFSMNKQNFKERRDLYFGSFKFSSLWRMAEIEHWIYQFATGLFYALVFSFIFTYAESIKVLSLYAFFETYVGLAITVIIAPLAALSIAKVIRLKWDPARSRHGKKGDENLWLSVTQNRWMGREMIKMFKRLAYARIFLSILGILLIPAIWVKIPYIALPYVYLGLMFIKLLIENTIHEYEHRYIKEVAEVAILYNEAAKREGYAENFHNIDSFSEVFGLLIYASGLLLGYGIYSIGILAPIVIPLAILAAIAIPISSFLVPSRGRDYKNYLKIEGGDFTEMDTGKVLLAGENDVIMTTRPDNPQVINAIPEKYTDDFYLLPWVEQLGVTIECAPGHRPEKEIKNPWGLGARKGRCILKWPKDNLTIELVSRERPISDKDVDIKEKDGKCTIRFYPKKDGGESPAKETRSLAGKGPNLSCGTVCEKGHEGSYNALDEQLKRQFEELRKILRRSDLAEGGSEGQTSFLTEEEADRALEKYAERFGIKIKAKQLQAYRKKIRKTDAAFKKINIFFSIPETGTSLFWVGNDYAGGHFNEAGTRIHISLPIILARGIDAGIAIAKHDLAHIQGKGHRKNDKGMNLVRSIAVTDRNVIRQKKVNEIKLGSGARLEIVRIRMRKIPELVIGKKKQRLNFLSNDEEYTVVRCWDKEGKPVAYFITYPNSSGSKSMRISKRIRKDLIPDEFEVKLKEAGQDIDSKRISEDRRFDKRGFNQAHMMLSGALYQGYLLLYPEETLRAFIYTKNELDNLGKIKERNIQGVLTGFGYPAAYISSYYKLYQHYLGKGLDLDERYGHLLAENKGKRLPAFIKILSEAKEKDNKFNLLNETNLEGVLTGFGYPVAYIGSCCKLYQYYLGKGIDLDKRYRQLLAENEGKDLTAFIQLLSEAKRKDRKFKLLNETNLEGVLTGFGYPVAYINSCYKLYQHYLDKDLDLAESYGKFLDENKGKKLTAFIQLLSEAKRKDRKFKLLNERNLEGVLTGFGYPAAYINSYYKLYQHYLRKGLDLDERYGHLLAENKGKRLPAFINLLSEAKAKDNKFNLLNERNLEGVLTGFGYPVAYISSYYKLYQYWKSHRVDVGVEYDFSGYDKEMFETVLEKIKPIGLPKGRFTASMGFYLLRVLESLGKIEPFKTTSIEKMEERHPWIWKRIMRRLSHGVKEIEMYVLLNQIKGIIGEEGYLRLLELIDSEEGELTSNDVNELKRLLRKIRETLSKDVDKNRSCGTICESGHEGSYNALDEQLKRQFEELRKILLHPFRGHTFRSLLKGKFYKLRKILRIFFYACFARYTSSLRKKDLTEEEADRALVVYAWRFGINITFKQLQDYRRKIRKAVSDEITSASPRNDMPYIFFSIPENKTRLFWVGNDYAGGHFNRAGTRIHISLPVILRKGIEAGIAIARHDLAHIQGKGHREDEGMKIVRNMAEVAKARTKNKAEGLVRSNDRVLIKLGENEKFKRRHIVIGDVHGDEFAVQQNLRDAGVVDVNGDWIGGNTVVVQLGDIMDKGPASYEVDVYLRKLQEQARWEGGDVVRLLGNHEFMFLWGVSGNKKLMHEWLTFLQRRKMRGSKIYDAILEVERKYGEKRLIKILKGEEETDNEDLKKYAKLYRNLRDDVRAKNIQAAYAKKNILFVHGGIPEFGRKLFEVADIDTAEKMAKIINGLVGGDFGEPTDFLIEVLNNMTPEKTFFPFLQIVGHVIGDEIRISDNGRVIKVDVGRSSNRGYLDIQGRLIRGIDLRWIKSTDDDAGGILSSV